MKNTPIIFLLACILALNSCQKEQLNTKNSLKLDLSSAKNGGGSTINLNQGLVAYYPFNGNANDASGNGNNGTVNGAVLSTDRSGKKNSAYYFNGITNNIVVPNSQSLIITGDHTFSFWMNTEGVGSTSNYSTIITKRNSSTVSYEVALYYDGGNSVYRVAEGRIIHPSIQEVIYSEQINFINSWQHIVAVCKNNTVSLYRNGILMTTPFGNSYSINSQDADADIYIGSIAGVQHFKGKIDELRVYNRALNIDEIRYISK